MNDVFRANGRAVRLFGGVMALLLLVLAGGFAARPGKVEARAQAEDLPNTLTVIVGGLDTRTPEEPENTDVFMIARVNFDMSSEKPAQKKEYILTSFAITEKLLALQPDNCTFLLAMH